MRLHFPSVGLICALLPVALSCSDGGVTKSTPDPNVLIFSSFEQSGRPSLAGWAPDDTTSLIQFSRDVPVGGGQWSLSITNTLLPQHMRVMQDAPALPGSTLYRFSFWAKAEGRPGKGMLGARRTGQPYVLRAMPLEADTAWLQYSASLTVDGDTNVYIVVGLSGSSTYESGTTWFDLVKLEKVD